MDDHAYLMNMTFFEGNVRDEEEIKFSEMMLDLWTSFADFEHM